MPERPLSAPPVATMRAAFGERYAQSVSFKEDAALRAVLEREAEPVLEALYAAFAGARPVPEAVHEPYALLSLLARKAAELAATPGVALALVQALVAALDQTGLRLTSQAEEQLKLVSVEGYSAAREERDHAELRQRAAHGQVAFTVAPGCEVVCLVGDHAASDLVPALDELARDLLRRDAKSCLLDLSRLAIRHEELARAVGHFCAVLATLGIALFLVGASSELRDQFERWSIARGASLFVDDRAAALPLALAAAGFELRPLRRWARLLRRRSGVVTT